MDCVHKNLGIVVSFLSVVAMLFGGFLWMNNKFNAVERDLIVIKTVLITKDFVKPDVFASQTTLTAGYARCHHCGAPLGSDGSCPNCGDKNPAGPDPDRNGG